MSRIAAARKLPESAHPVSDAALAGGHRRARLLAAVRAWGAFSESVAAMAVDADELAEFEACLAPSAAVVSLIGRARRRTP